MDLLIEETLTERCKRLEHFETDAWAPRAILKREILTPFVVDPCVGTGVMAEAARAAGHSVLPIDIHDWGYPGTHVADFLTLPELPYGGNLPFTIFANPPFSEAVEFVKHSMDLGARKIVMFQRFAFWESNERKGFWNGRPPNRVYVCGDRATCWRHDLPKDEKGNRYDPETGKKLAGSSTAHGFYIWEQGHPPGTQLSHIWKDDAA